MTNHENERTAISDSTMKNRYSEEIKVLDDPFCKIVAEYKENPARKAASDAYFAQLKPQDRRLILSVDGGGTRGYITLHCLA